MMKQLQSLETSDPAKFKEVTGDIATKLQDAAKTAADSGDPQGAEALNDLAAKFKTSSETGKMPHVHKGHGGHHTAAPPADADSDPSSTSATSTTASSISVAAGKYQDLTAMFQQNSGNDPLATLTSILSSDLSSQQT